MIRCRDCNSELTDQARFCNVCGLPQNPKELEQENSTHIGQKALDTNTSIPCENCASELPKDARFCAVCGTAQNYKKSLVQEATSHDPATPASTFTIKESTSTQFKPSTSVKPEEVTKNVKEPFSKDAKNVPILPNTIARPPFFPSRPTSNGIKPSAEIQQLTTSKPELSSEPSIFMAQNNQLSSKINPEAASLSVESRNLDSDQGKRLADFSNLAHDQLSSPASKPSLIRPVTPKSSARSFIPSRPDSTGQTLSTQQSTEATQMPEYTKASSIAKVASPTQNKTDQRSTSVFMQAGGGNQVKRQISQLTVQQTQVNSPPKATGNRLQSRTQEQIAGVQTTSVEPMWQNATTYDSDELSIRSTSTLHVNGKNGVSETPTMDFLNPASFMATRKAAEQWRKSWRDRQYAEAGPAENVSRGQASVPMPLTPMHQSLVRMRALQKNDKKRQGRRTVNFGTWIIIFLLICLIISLGTYIFISYIPNSPFGVTSITTPTQIPQPTLILVGMPSQSIKIGQSIQLHGKYFGVNQNVIFLRDTAKPILDTRGNNISTHTDNQGAFSVTIPTDSLWSVGSHSIEAVDESNSQSAFQTIQVIPAGTVTTTSTDLSVLMLGKPASQLTFSAVMGEPNPEPQQITITNTSHNILQWTATTSTNNDLNWLLINDNNDSGQLAISQPHSILISVNTTGLKSTNQHHPYVGQIIFTINNSQLLTLPVQLQITDATPEMVFSPNPIVARIAGNTCQSGVTLTLINLGTAAISWAVNPDLRDKIKFVNPGNGQLLESGTLLPSGSLLPSGQPGDTVILALQCTNIQLGQAYHVSVYANQLSWSESVILTK